MPAVPNYEQLKKNLILFAARRIQNAVDCLQQRDLCTSAFLDVNYSVKKYVDAHQAFHKNGYRFEVWAKKHWRTEGMRYALWGVREDTAAYWRELIQSKYPNAELAAIFDRYKQGCVLEVELENPDCIKDLPEDVAVIVCAAGATSEARQMFKRLGWGTERYCITADCFITQEEL